MGETNGASGFFLFCFRVSLFSLDQNFVDRKEKYENLVSPGSRIVESGCLILGSNPLTDFCVSLAGVGRLIAEAQVTPIVVPFWHEGENNNPSLTTFFISFAKVHPAHYLCFALTGYFILK